MEDKGDIKTQTQEETQEMKILLPQDGDLCDPGDQPIRVKDASCCGRTRSCLKSQLFVILNVLGIVIGFGLAFGLRQVDLSEDAIIWISLPGEVFLRLLKVTIVPLIVSNIIAGSAAVDPASNGRAGLLALGYNLMTNCFTAFLGVVLAVTVKPGARVSGLVTEERAVTGMVGTQDIFIDLIRNLFPDNIVRATIEKVQTTYIESPLPTSGNMTNGTTSTLTRNVSTVPETNILGLLFFCGAFGVAVGMNPEKGRAIKDFFRASADIILIVLGWFVWVSPIGVCSLIISAIVQVPNLETVILKVIIFFVVVTCAVLFLELVFAPTLYLLVLRRNPYPILLASARAWAIAFGSAGSACAMPEMFRVVEAQGCDTRLSSLTIPINVTLNANGSGLFITIAVIFLAQTNDLSLGIGQYTVIGFLTALSAMVLPSIPSASIVTVVMILGTLSIPTTSVGLLFTVEWFLDRIRTTANVVSEIYGVLIIDHLCKRKPRTQDSSPRNSV